MDPALQIPIKIDSHQHSGSYGSVMNVVIAFIKRRSSDEQASILGGTCCEVYGC